MFRILLIVAWLAVTVYAIADWARTREEDMPGRIPRILWLVIILLTIPSFSLGSVVWLIARAVGRAEAQQNGATQPPQRPLFPRASRAERPSAPPAPLAPDDDPEFLFRLERDIRRRRAEEEARSPKGPGADGTGTGGRGTGGPGTDVPLTGDEGGPDALPPADATPEGEVTATGSEGMSSPGAEPAVGPDGDTDQDARHSEDPGSPHDDPDAGSSRQA